MYTVDSLKKDLKAMGLTPKDTVLMHSSMKAIGQVDGGADAVLDALSEYFEDGLLCLPSLNWEIINDKPRVYDVNNTPSIIGILTEMFRKRPGVIRSLHPTHSISAKGRDAASFTEGDELTGTPCGRQSTWGKLMDRGGKILMVGCGLDRCTFIHGVEEWCDIPNRLTEPLEYTIIRADGSRFEATCAEHSGHPSTYFGLVEQDLREGGALRDGRFGAARVLVLDARKTFEVLKVVLAKTPGLFDEREA